MDVLISSQTDTEAAPVFFAIAPNGVVSSGDTPGEALDALLAHAPNTATESPDELLPLLFVVRAGKGDPFFSDAQNARLQTLQQQRNALSPAEAQELDDLLQAEIRASGKRAAFIAQQMNKPA